MSKTVTLPALAEGIEEGDVVAVLVSEGDTVQADQPLIELETEKATVPVPAPFGGKVVRLHAKSGATIKVGEPIADIETEAGAEAAPPPAEKPAEKPEPKKAPAEPAPPTPTEKPAPPRPEVQAQAEAAPPPQPEQPAPEREGAPLPAGPATRRLARELGVDLNQVAQQAPGKRLSNEEVKEFARAQLRGGAAGAGPALPDFSQFGPVRREKFSSLRRKIGETMHRSWTSIPHVHQFHEADITELAALQKRMGAKFKEQGATLTMTGMLLKAAAATLKRFPQFNATLDMGAGEVIYKDHYHIGVAVDTPAGLIVPVIRDVDQKDLFEISAELADVAERTRERQVKLEEVRGATFTISNLGGIGGGAFTPIINPPEVAVLGVGRGRLTPTYRDGALTPRMMLPLCVAYDHRLIDGADGARFITHLVNALENYEEAVFFGLG